MADENSNKRKILVSLVKAAFWGGVIATILEIVILYPAVDDWGYSVGHPQTTDNFILVGLILSIPAMILERILGLDVPGNFNAYLTAFLSIILCALAFVIIAGIASFRQFIRRK